MLKVALRNLLGHKLRTLFTALAIALGVGFMAGTFVLTDTISSAFDDLFEEVGAGTDAVVQGAAPFEAGGIETGGAVRPDLDPGLVDVVAGVDGVAESLPVVSGYAVVLDDEGDPIGGAGAPSFGFNWTGTPEVDVVTIVDGDEPSGPTGAVIDEKTAQDAGLAVGDTFDVSTLSGVVELEVAGIARFGDSGSLAGASFVILDTPAALETFTISGRIQQISVLAEDGVTQEELVERIEPVLPAGAEVITGEASTEQNQDSLEQGIGFFRTFLNGIGSVSLAAGAFLIYNTFGIIIGQRIRELALLRALGSSRRQVLTSVLAESAVVGLIASLIGLLGGILLAMALIALIGAIGIDLPSTTPVIAPRTILVSVLVGTTITVLSSLLPARKASRVPPVAALRETAVESDSRSMVRAIAGGVVLLVAAGLLGSGVAAGAVGRALVGVVGLFAGVVVLGPFLVPGIVRVLGAPFRLIGFPGTLGRDNARRNPKRSSGTAAALMLAVTIITFIAVAAVSFNDSFASATDKYLKADLEVSSFVPSLGPDLVDRLEEKPEVAAVTGVQRGEIQLNDSVRPVYGINPASVEDIFDLRGVEGDLAGMGPDEIAIDRATAELGPWPIGTELDALMPDGTERTLTVAAVYEDGGIVAQNSDGHFLVDDQLFQDHFGELYQYLLRVDVRAADGVSEAELREVVEAEVEDFPTAEVRNKEELKDAAQTQLLAVLGFLFVLLGLALVIGALGVTITLALSVFERTREIGLLRAVGTTRGQLRSAIIVESVLLTLLGAILGLVIGITGAIAVVRTQADVIVTLGVSIPIPLVVTVFVASIVIGVLAAAVPAFRASRMDVLQAVTVE